MPTIQSELKIRTPHRGYLSERLETNPHEAAFTETWDRETEQGILASIIGQCPTSRDNYVVASVIQWLGTSVGHSFLTRALQKTGYTLYCYPAHLRWTYDGGDPLLAAMNRVNAYTEWLADIKEAEAKSAQLLFDLCEPN